MSSSTLKVPQPRRILTTSPTSFSSHRSSPLWYLAYGSNLSSNTFKGRRGIKPIDQRNVLVRGLELTFDLQGLPYLEPRFANCRFADVGQYDGSKENGGGDGVEDPWTGKGALIGVAYLITPEDFAKVLATEGGGSSYKMVAVTARVLPSYSYSDSDPHSGLTPNLPDSGSGVTQNAHEGNVESKAEDGEVETIQAFTLLAPSERTRATPGRPSARYLKIILDGAREHALPPSYITYITTLKPYTAHSIRQKIGRVLFLVTWAPTIFPIFMLSALLGRLLAMWKHRGGGGGGGGGGEGEAPRWLQASRRILWDVMWWTYDHGWRRVFGDGEGEDGV
ncbi:hypothetical protein BD410DRAFT_806733 [Rickenella mellea]|uniref:gamma-glutamylcyclotransferase n=1 Tax=Rickenella mellea TaxID=50990 RepID=A0A4Y7PSP2_9AGAM|nr:hypothetical protein BD410DRAFT_806733 [Rickenella mellea]